MIYILRMLQLLFPSLWVFLDNSHCSFVFSVVVQVKGVFIGFVFL